MKKQSKKPIKKHNKATQIQKEQRLMELEKLLIVGMPYKQMFRFTAEKWKITSRQTEYYISEIHKDWHERHEKDKDKNRDLAIKRRNDLYFQGMREGGDRRLALEAEKDKCKLQGLYEENINIKSDMIITLMDPELKNV